MAKVTNREAKRSFQQSLVLSAWCHQPVSSFEISDFPEDLFVSEEMWMHEYKIAIDFGDEYGTFLKETEWNLEQKYEGYDLHWDIDSYYLEDLHERYFSCYEDCDRDWFLDDLELSDLYDDYPDEKDL